MATPVRDLRQRLADALRPLGAPVYDVLPEEAYEPPCFAVGLVGVGQSQRAAGALLVLSCEVTLIGDRAYTDQGQMHIDDLEWGAWQALSEVANGYPINAVARSATVAGREYPAVVFAIESTTPC